MPDRAVGVNVAAHNARFCTGARRDERARGYYRDALSGAFEELLQDAKHHKLGAMSLDAIVGMVGRPSRGGPAQWLPPSRL
jgi:hypothetical protein